MYKNSEGYSDPTAGEAMRRFNKRKRKKRGRRRYAKRKDKKHEADKAKREVKG